MENLNARKSGPGRRAQTISIARTSLEKYSDEVYVYNATVPYEERLPAHNERNLPADFAGAKLIRAALSKNIGHRC